VSSLVRGATLSQYAEVARSVGLEPLEMLRSAGLSPSCLREPDAMIPADAVRRLLELSADTAGVEDFGLRMAETRHLSNLGPIGLVIREEPTLRRALASLARYMRLHNEALFVHVEQGDGIVVIREEVLVAEPGAMRQTNELAVGALYRMLRELLGPSWEPLRVCFSHGAPASLVSHLRVFGRFVQFGRDFNGIVCAARDLDARLPAADPVMARYARQYVESMFAQPNMTTGAKVKQLVLVLLSTGRCSVEQVARQLGVDRRSVHRQLAREGETFTSILGAVRASLAARYLEGGERSVAEVAELLGFSAQSAFARWFRGRFGSSVTAWRKRGVDKAGPA
jgi:AraC-like DNA-binding protein